MLIHYLKNQFRKEKWEKGNGTLLLGSTIMVTCLSIVIMFLQVYINDYNAAGTQLVADTLSDATAVYLQNNGGDYDTAVEAADEIADLIEKETGVTVTNIEIDEDQLENDNIVEVIATTTSGHLTYTVSLSGNDSHLISKTSATKFSSSGIYSNAWVNRAVNVADDDTYGYCQDHRELGSCDEDTHSLDCSSLVYYSLLNSGFTKEQIGTDVFSTASMGQWLVNAGFQKIQWKSTTNQNDLIEGDILVSPGQHTEIYIGNGQTVAAHKDEHGGIKCSESGSSGGDQTGHEIDVSDLGTSTFHYIYRYAGDE
ncbi:MAG: NlpC/P60 family protein [Clostridiales bacterium]|nr:NlpC/P60 family protein [Clostridiales bacterium]